jgi:hypothetical protein
MARAAVQIAVAAVVLLAGCSGVAPTSDQPAAATQSPTETTDCPPPKNFDGKSLPDVPENLTGERAVDFATAYENATLWNDRVPDADHYLSTSTRGELVADTETGYVVHVRGSASYAACSNGERAVADAWPRTNYFVNETLVVRLTYPENKTDDPRYNGGTVVES